MRLSQHGKQRIIERNDNANYIAEAKKMAKVAYRSGYSVNHFQKDPEFFRYLQYKEGRSNTCKLKVYKDMIYIWRGSKKTLVTAYPVPQEFLRKEVTA